MQAVRTLVLRHLHLGARPPCYGLGPRLRREMSASAGQDGGPRAGSESEDAVRARVVELVKKFDKVTETADFQKDLSLDSLDQVELVMAFENEFSVEIPDDKADKLSCCADVAKYIISESESNKADKLS
ncbi:acyl carrier protein isoform X1 [Oryza brachyantha]|nr:acyl carrier protein isoform X1 [Oryza brachyantha]